MDELPLEIIVHIFQYLSKEEQIKLSILNKKFREALFSPSLWTEYDKRLEVPACQLNSFKKFLKQTPWLKYLHFHVYETKKKGHSKINLSRVLKHLNNLECLSFQLYRCKFSTTSNTFFPCSLKHISLEESNITDRLLIGIADSCYQLEHIKIELIDNNLFTRKGLTYLLNKVKETLKTLILSEPFLDAPVFSFGDCPPNLTTLCLEGDIEHFLHDDEHLSKLPNLKKLELLCIMDDSDFFDSKHPAASLILENCSLTNLRFLYLCGCFPFGNEDWDSKFIKLPNFQVLYLDNCFVQIDALVKFVRECSSLKVLAWKSGDGYSDAEISKLKKLKKETAVKIYLSFTGNVYPGIGILHFSHFPNENFDCLKNFKHHGFFHKMFFDKGLKCKASIIKKSKALLGI